MFSLEEKTTDAVEIMKKAMQINPVKVECSIPYMGITHGVPDKLIMDEGFCLSWKKGKCSQGIHLFDEVWSDGEHYLSCDACNLIVNIKSIDTSWVEDEE